MKMKTEEDYLEGLVAFASVSENKVESKKCAQFCADFFKNRGMHSTVIEYNGYPNVIATTHATKTPKLFLQGHLDVVPGKDDLFKVTKTAGKLHGRGVIDMKFATASYMRLVDRLGTDIKKYDFGIMLSFDEEIGGHNGVEALLNDGYRCEVCILPDSGKNWSLEASSKGGWWFRVSKDGKTAHASEVIKSTNAAELLLPVISEIIALRQHYEHEMLSLHMTEIRGGEAINQIPDYAEAIFDMRYKNDVVVDKIRQQILEVCGKYQAQLETIETSGCCHLDKDNPYVKTFLAVAEETLGKQISYSDSHGATDGRYFRERNMPVITIQPTGGGMHADNEWIEVGGMEKLTEILLRYIEKCVKIAR